MKALVTIAVATYHSARFIEETLESVYNQTYSNLALIVSDDCSKDDTIAIINKWVTQERVKTRFHSIEVITVPINTGVSANCNRCIAAVPSDWFKFIAGDDILLPNCIEDNMNFVGENPKAKIIFSQVKLYQDYFKEKNYIKTTPFEYPNNLMASCFSAKDQYQLLLLSDRIHYTPSVFMNKQAILKVGGYDESNRLVEDYPMWLKLTGSGEQLYYFHKITVGYRIHAKATNNVNQEVLFKPSLFNNYSIRKTMVHPHLPWEIVQSEKQRYWVSRFFQAMRWNYNTKLYRTLYLFACDYVNPFHYLYAIKKRMPFTKDNIFYK